MSAWTESRLGVVAPFKYGKALREENRQAGEYDVYSSAGVCGRSDDTLAPRGIVIGRKGTAGSLFYSATPFFCIDTAFYVDEVADDCDLKYIFYYMKLMNLGSYNNDAAVPGLNRNLAHKLKIKLPRKDIQSRIADILTAYDDAIENNNRRIALLEQAARELYREWFVRMRFPGHETAKFVNGLPERWEVKRLGEMVNITSSRRSYESDRVGMGIPLYRSKEIIQISNGESITEPLYISEEWFDGIRKRFGAPEKNDILITSRGTIGVTFLVDAREFYFSDGNLTWLQSSKCPDRAAYIDQWLNSEVGQYLVDSVAIGTSQKALPIDGLKRIRLLKPDDRLLNAFSKIVMPLIDEKRMLLSKSRNLARQRNLLLPRLMSGKPEVTICRESSPRI
jgi:type I restriction enzyme S subunit